MTIGRIEQRRWSQRVVIVLALGLGAALFSEGLGGLFSGEGGMRSAGAAITTPGHNSTVRGIVQIHENSGGSNHFICGSGNTAIHVFHPNGSTLHRWEKGSGGSFTVNWDTIGRPNLNNYRIISQGRNRSLSFTSCRLSGWFTISDIRVHLDNRSRLDWTSIPSSGFWGESVTLQALLRETTTLRAISGRTIRFSLDGQSGVVTGTTASNGRATVSFPVNRQPGGTTFRAQFLQDCCFRASSNARGFTVLKRPTTTQYTGATSVFSQESFTASARLRDQRSGANIAGRPVRLELMSGSTIIRSAIATTNSSGIASAPILADVNAGSYTVRARFLEDAWYTGSTASASLSVLHRPTTLTYLGDTSGFWDETATLQARLADTRAGGAGIGGKTVSFTVGSETRTATTASNGIATVSLDLDQTPGSYSVASSFGGDGVYASSATSPGFEILKRPTTIVYQGDLEGYWDETASLQATLTDTRRASALAAFPVTFTLGTDSVGASTNSSGVASATLDLTQTPGSYTVSAAYGGDAFYESVVDGDPFEILKRPTALVYHGDLDGYWDEVATFSATLTDVRRATGLEAFDVTFTLGTESVSATTDSLGVATATMLLDQVPGAFTISAVYPGDAFYVASSDADAFELFRRPTALDYRGDTEGFWDEVATLEAVLTDVRRDVGLEAFDVSITLGAFAEDVQTAGGGIAATTALLDQLPLQPYTVAAAFAGDAFFVESDDADDFVIHRRPTDLAYTGADEGDRGHVVTLSAVLTDETPASAREGDGLEGRTLSFTLGSWDGDAVTDADGVAEIDVLLDQVPGSYTVEVSYAGDPYWVESLVQIPFSLEWEYTFIDDDRVGTVFLNVITREFELAVPGATSGIKHDPDMQVWWLPEGLIAPPGPPSVPGCVEDPTTGEPICPEPPEVPEPPDPTIPPEPPEPPSVPECVENPATGEQVCPEEPEVPEPPEPTPPEVPEPTPPEVPEVPECFDDPTGGDPFCPRDYLPLPGGASAASAGGLLCVEVPVTGKVICAPDELPVPLPTEQPEPPEVPDLPEPPDTPEPPDVPDPPEPPEGPEPPEKPDGDCVLPDPQGCLPVQDPMVCDVPGTEGCEERVVTIVYHDDDVTLAGWFDLRTNFFSAAAHIDERTFALRGFGRPTVTCVENPMTGERICADDDPPPPPAPPEPDPTAPCVEDPRNGDRICPGDHVPQDPPSLPDPPDPGPAPDPPDPGPLPDPPDPGPAPDPPDPGPAPDPPDPGPAPDPPDPGPLPDPPQPGPPPEPPG